MNKCPQCGFEFKDEGRSAGGNARARKLSAEQRRNIARYAANKRWAKERGKKYANPY